MGHSSGVCWLLTKKERKKKRKQNSPRTDATIIARRSERGGLANAARTDAVLACERAASNSASSSARLRVCLRVSAVHVSALRVRVSVCVGSAANGIRLRLCVARLRVCVCVSVWAGFVACPASVLRTPGRPRAGAVTHSAQHARHALHAQLRLRLRGERGRRVCPHFVCVRVWSRCLYFLSLLDIFERNIAV